MSYTDEEVLAAVVGDDPQPEYEETPGDVSEEVAEEDVEPHEEEGSAEGDEGERVVPLKAVIEERKKRQELEAQLKAVAQKQEELRASIPAPPQAPPKDIFEAYDRDSDGVLRDLNGEIQRLVDDDPYGNAAKIEKLRDLKDEFRRREIHRVTHQLSTQTEVAKHTKNLMEQVPDFAERVNDYTKFAIEELGYTQDDIARCDLVNGEAAVREIVRVVRLYQKLNATPEKKEARPRPPAVENPGRGIPKAEPNHNQLFEKAKRSGTTTDWAAYLAAKGLV